MTIQEALDLTDEMKQNTMSRKTKIMYLSMLERQNTDAGLFDVDTVILHDGSATPAELVALTEEASAEGSVLVARQKPLNRNYRRLIRFQNGEVAAIEHG